MPETKVETVTCPYCKNKIPVKEYLDTHYDECEKRLAHPAFQKIKTPLKIVTDEEEEVEEFLARIDEEEIEVPRRDRFPAAAAPLIPVNPGEEGPDEIIDEEKTYLIRDEILQEVDGKVEEPEVPVEEIPPEASMEEPLEEPEESTEEVPEETPVEEATP